MNPNDPNQPAPSNNVPPVPPAAPAEPSPPAETPPQPTADNQQEQTQTPPQQSTPGVGSFDSKVWKPKYLGIILAVVVIYQVLNIVMILAFLLAIGVLIYGFTVITKLKAAAPGSISGQDKDKAMWIMAVDPILAQALYYYRLRKVHPEEARIFNKIGWKVFGTEILISIILGILYVVLFGAPK